MTAAHCVENNENEYLNNGIALLGLRTQSSLLRLDLEYRYIKKVYSHPNYDSDSLDYDYALLQIDSSAYSPIQLISSKDNDDNSKKTAMG